MPAKNIFEIKNWKSSTVATIIPAIWSLMFIANALACILVIINAQASNVSKLALSHSLISCGILLLTTALVSLIGYHWCRYNPNKSQKMRSYTQHIGLLLAFASLVSGFIFYEIEVIY